MKVTPVNTPQITVQTTHTDSRARAVDLLNKLNTPATVVPQTSQQAAGINPNAIAPEDMTAVKAPEITQEVDTSTTTMDAAAAPVETPAATETAPKTPEVDPVVSKQWAALARQEKANRAKIQAQEQQLAAREAAIAAREASITGQQQAPKSTISLDQLKSDPLRLLAEAGVSYDELTQQILTQQPANPRYEATINELKSEIQALRDESKKMATSAEERQTAAYKAAVNQIRTDVQNMVKVDPAFETIKATGSENDVVELIERTFKEDGIVMDTEEAAKEIEAYLEEEVMKLTELEKIKKRRSASQVQAQTDQQKTQASATPKTEQQQAKTLTNNIATSRPLSAKERAVLAFKGELNKR